MLIAYARVTSISSGTLSPGCERIFEDKASGVRNEYPPLGVKRATIYPLPGLGAKAKTGEAVRADR
jgi:hypothetical protein